MTTELQNFLSKKTTSELLKFFKETFRVFIKKDHNAGLGSFNKLLVQVGTTQTTLEKNVVILETPFGQKPIGKRTKEVRDEIQKLIGDYEEDCVLDDKLTDSEKKSIRYEHGRKKAREYLEELIRTICKNFVYKIDFASEKITRLAIPQKDHKNKLYFKCYYWFENDERNIRNVKTGYLEVGCINRNNIHFELKNAELNIFSSNSEREGWAFLKSQNITIEDGIIYAFFENDGDERIKTQITINVGRDLPAQWTFITGTYMTIGPGSKVNPMAGLMILERLTEEHDEIPPTNEIQPLIHHYLHRTRLFAIPPLFDNLKRHPSSREIELLQKYVGWYAGTYFRKAKGAINSNDDRVDNFLFRINPNGEASMKQPHIQDAYLGRVRVLTSKNDALIGYFDFLLKENTYRFTIYFNKEFKGPSGDLLYGVYAGIEREDPYVPTAGRMIFKRVGIEGNEEELIKKHVFSIKPVENFLADIQNKDYVQVLRGKVLDNNYIEELPSNQDFFGFENLEMPYVGTFYTYYLSTMQNRIYKVPLKILADGTVEMKTRFPNSPKVHKGIAIYNGTDRLSLYMEKVMHKHSHFHLLFSMGNTSGAENGDHFFGVSSKVDSRSSPAARLEILLKEDFIFEKTSSKVYKVDTAEYKAENEEYRGLLTYLTGRSNRILVSKKTVNANFSRSNDHLEYFYAACYLCKKGSKKDDLKNGVKYLYQAYLHGFGTDESDIQLLNEEMGDSFKDMASYTIKVTPDLSKLPSLNFKTLVKRIRDRSDN